MEGRSAQSDATMFYSFSSAGQGPDLGTLSNASGHDGSVRRTRTVRTWWTRIFFPFAVQSELPEVYNLNEELGNWEVNLADAMEDGFKDQAPLYDPRAPSSQLPSGV